MKSKYKKYTTHRNLLLCLLLSEASVLIAKKIKEKATILHHMMDHSGMLHPSKSCVPGMVPTFQLGSYVASQAEGCKPPDLQIINHGCLEIWQHGILVFSTHIYLSSSLFLTKYIIYLIYKYNVYKNEFTSCFGFIN